MATSVPSTQKSALDAGSLFRVDGLVALVTGGGTGIGLMIAKALAHNGASKVYIAGRRESVLQQAANAIATGTVVPITCDVTSKPSLEAAAAQVERETGHLHLLVCNAGVAGPQAPPPTAETSLEAWVASNAAHDTASFADTFAVNTIGVWMTCLAFLPLLEKGNGVGGVRQSGQIVVTSSIAAMNRKAPGGYAYGQSKAATNLLVRQLAVALPQWNIRANCICPGLFPSEMSEPIVKFYAGTSAVEDAVLPSDVVPLRRMGTEADMAGAILYLASPAGGYVNGATIVVDGGRLGNFPSAG